MAILNLILRDRAASVPDLPVPAPSPIVGRRSPCVISSMTLPSTMLAITIPTPGGPDALRPAQVALPPVGPGDILIRVAAAGLNAPDLGQRRGSYPPPPDASPLPGLEVSGEVAALGEGVTRWRLGDRVVALCNGGGYAEFVAVPQGQVLPAPDGWSLAAAAALPETFFTVTQTLVMRAGLDAGMWVLVHGAAGGIGGAAIQIARALGARPIGVVSSADKAAYARALGAEATIDRRGDDLVARVLDITGRHGADRIVDIVGGDLLQKNIAASARFGHIVLVSTQAGAMAEINASQVMMKQLTLSGSTLRPQTPATKAAIADRLATSVWPAIADGRIRPPRVRWAPLADAPRGHRALERSDNYGKLVLLTAWGQAIGAAGNGDNPIESG